MRQTDETLRPCAGLLSAIVLAGCANTIRGAGRDIGNAVDATGEAVEEIVR